MGDCHTLNIPYVIKIEWEIIHFHIAETDIEPVHAFRQHQLIPRNVKQIMIKQWYAGVAEFFCTSIYSIGHRNALTPSFA